MKTRSRSLTRIFGVPLLIGLASLAGLVGALFLDGGWDLAWASLLGVATATPILLAFTRR